MVYPVFEYTSIKTRCAHDIAQFIQETIKEEEKKGNNLTFVDDTALHLYTPSSSDKTKDSLKTHIRPIIDYFDTYLDKGTYLAQISHIDPPLQYQLWIARTYLFYQLLIYVTATFLDKALYDNVYTDLDTFHYMPELTKENLVDFKMGIFGSMSPTSDIDIGIQYSGTTLHTPALAYIVSRFENLFYIFTDKSSLEWDIETYADMMTLPSPACPGLDYFYLDSSQFGLDEFNKMLPYAYASIIRNSKMADKDLATFDEMIADERFNKEMKLSDVLSEFPPADNTLFTKAIGMVTTFLEGTEEERRYVYYQKVQDAEQLLFDTIPNRTQLPLLDKATICELMVKIGEALLYRMESYTCAPTVTHVVRILQASKDNPNKYKTATPSMLCNGKLRDLEPFCTIGTYGYALSMLEQIGYAYRFFITYCNTKNHYNEIKKTKCTKKIKKYKERYLDGVTYMKRLKTSPNTINRSSLLPQNCPITYNTSIFAKKPFPTTPSKLKRIGTVAPGAPRKMQPTRQLSASGGSIKKQTKKKYMRKTHHTRKIRKSSAKTHSKSK